MIELFMGWTRGDYLALIGIVVSSLIAITIYLLQKRISDKQKVDHRFEIEQIAGDKLRDIKYNGYSSKIQLYNSKLLSKKYFSENKRSFIWGYPYHGAEFYDINFDGLEFVVGLEEWNGNKFYKVGLIPFERILGVKPDGDGSFSGMIVFVKPKLLQKDKYSIAYTSFRYYPIKARVSNVIFKPLKQRILDSIQGIFLKLRYTFYYKWKIK